MRGLVSSTCLLFLIAMVAILGTDAILYCEQLVDDDNLIGQLKECDGEIIGYQSSEKHHFDLSKLSQEDANTVLYENQVPKGFRGHVTIQDSSLESLNLGFTKFGEPHTVKIIGNKNLTRLAFSIKATAINVKLTLRGNKQLSWGSIKMLKKIPQINKTNSDIQEYHDCSFIDGKVKALDDLQGCSTVDGDLIINENTVIPSIMPSVRINMISNGCLRIENSKLTSIDFLEELLDGKSREKCADGGQSYIKGNKQLCIPSEDWPKWNAVYPLSYAGTCRDRCSLDFALANQDAAKAPCDIVVGDVKITGNHRRRRQSGTPPKLAHWDRVKELEGTLEVSGTDLEDITIFNNLEKITNPSPEKVALTVMKNPKMTKFDLPKLENITMPSNTWSEPIYFQDYGDFTFTYPQGKRWEKITGRSHLLIPMEPEPTTKGPSTTPRSTTLSPAEMKNKEAEEHNASVKSNQDLMLAAAIIGPPLIVIFAGLGIWCYCRRKNKKGKLTKDDHDVFTPLMPVLNKARALINKLGDAVHKDADTPEGKSEEITIAALSDQPDDFSLAENFRMLVEKNNKSIEYRQVAARNQMALDGEEIPFKMTDVIKNVNAPELDLQRAQNLLTQAPLSKMKHTGKPFRHMEKYKILCFNPKELNLEPVPYIEKYDRVTVFRYLVTHCSEFFVVNYHLLPEAIADCSGPYYTPNNSLLAEIDGPVYVIGDIHEALHVLQTILNLDLDGEGKKHKIHPMFRNRYLFLGDYLDKGEHGLEVYFLLCFAARLFPDLFTVLRGNHDGEVVSTDPIKYEDSTINKYAARLDQEKTNNTLTIDNPYHFADLMVIDMITKITPFLPMAAIINGQTFAAHGGFTLGMATTKMSIRQIFKAVPVPYYDEYANKCQLAGRYFPAKSKVADNYNNVKKEDAYTRGFKTFTDGIKTWRDARNEYLRAKVAAIPNTPRDPRFESRFPGLNMVMWSDPGHVLGSAGNQRRAGCTYNTEIVLKMMENNKATKNTKSIEDIIRAHQVVGIAHACDHRVTTVFTNCNNILIRSAQIRDLKVSTKLALMRCSSILRINENGSRTVILLVMTTEKEGDKPLANPNRKVKRKFEVEKDEEQRKEDEKKEKKKRREQEQLCVPNDGKKRTRYSIQME